MAINVEKCFFHINSTSHYGQVTRGLNLSKNRQESEAQPFIKRDSQSQTP